MVVLETAPSKAATMAAPGRHARDLEIFAAIAEALNGSIDVAGALERTLRMTAEMLSCESGWIWLRDQRTRKFYLAAAYNLPPYLQEPVRMAGSKCWCIEGLLDGDFRSRNVDAIECSRLRPAVLRNQTALTRGIAYHASVAIRFGDRDLGLMNLTRPGLSKIGGDDLRLLTTIAAQLGIAVERARLAETAMQVARMRERAELARDIHDTFAQDLTAITLQLETALQYLGGNGEAVGRVTSALEVARESVQRARRSVEALRTSPETGSPLDAALAELARTFTSQCGVPVHLRVDAAGAYPELERVAYRIAQEALTNVRRHAKAKNVWLQAVRRKGDLVLTIRDDGKGLANEAPRGMGIPGMEERARFIGGTLRIRRHSGGGTEVRATLPSTPA
jgi:two-component system NarL family sensor kinase